MRPRIKIYTASKVFRAPMWQSLRTHYPDLEFTSSWIDMKIGPLEEADATICRKGWIDNLNDVANSDHLVCYAEHDDPLSGTLVEIGAMLMKSVAQQHSYGRHRVYLVGDCERFSTWRHHPNVVIVDPPKVLAPQYQVAVVLDRLSAYGE